MAKSPRPPVVAIMGHIDHGKSTLLDYIRKVNTTEKEAGGITQHVAAYETESKITFLDTPGHEAFQSIRARGAKAADIGVLVVAADEGVKPQTLEAIKKITESGTPMLVAITKTDKPNANVEMVKQALAESNVYLEGYGGEVPFVTLSAKTGEGVKEFLDLLNLMAELERLEGDRGRNGHGIIIESRRDSKKGVTAVGVIKDGSIKIGQFAASAGAIAPIRFLETTEGKQVDKISFSAPVQITGWDSLPLVGATFEIFDEKKAAQLYANSEAVKARIERKSSTEKEEEGVINLPIIIKADTSGSLEAIEYELKGIRLDRIKPKIVCTEIGPVGETDVKSAMTTAGTIILAFHVGIDSPAAALAERTKIDIESFDIIYKLKERVGELLTKREPRIEVEEVHGRAKVLKCFSHTKNKQVIGGRVENGLLEDRADVKIIRRDEEVGRGKICELQMAKMKVGSVSEGAEFGSLVESKIEIVPGDYLERVVMVTK